MESAFNDLDEAVLSIDGPNGYSLEIDLLNSSRLTGILEPGDGTRELGERGDYFLDPNARVRRPGGIYYDTQFLPAPGQYEFYLAARDSDGQVGSDTLVVERPGGARMPVAAWPLVPAVLALGTVIVARKHSKH